MVNRRVYPVGYSALGAREWLDELTKDPNVLIMDTRKVPYSWRVNYRQEELRKTYGDRYHWCGRYLGNLGYNDGYIKIADPATGIRGLIQYLSEGHDLVILCECASASVCHRSVIVDLLLREFDGVEVIQPPKLSVVPGMIRAFSTRPPYGTWLANPQKFLEAGIIPKEIENRSTDFTGGYLGPVLIQQSKTFDPDAIPYWMVHAPSLGNGVLLDAFSAEKKDYPLGCIVGIADLVRVVHEDEDSRDTSDPWFCGPYGLILKNAKPIDPPIPYKGQLSLFHVPEDILQRG